MQHRTLGVALAFCLGAAHVGAAQAVVIAYDDRGAFSSALGASITDDYSAAGYQHGDRFDTATLDAHSDAHMSAVLGETRYHTTGHADLNLTGYTNWSHPGGYCAGCNGSFLLDFTATSLGTPAGVFGVGFDFFNAQAQMPYSAFVTYGDGAIESFTLPVGGVDMAFFGLTSDQLIRSIHFGLAGGSATTAGSFGIDNLTIGAAGAHAVPEPSTLALFALGVALLGIAFVRRRTERSRARKD